MTQLTELNKNIQNMQPYTEEEALDRTVWRTRFGSLRTCRKTTQWMTSHWGAHHSSPSQSHPMPFTSFLIHLQLGLPAGFFRTKTFNCLAIQQFCVKKIIFNLRTAAFKAYCAIWVIRSNFCHQASPRVSPRESTQRRKVELWARNVRYFWLISDFQVTFGDLLQAVLLRHGTDGLTS
jgi:hypothetical protein